MIHGLYGRADRPYVRATLQIPRLQRRLGLYLLVDTGAEPLSFLQATGWTRGSHGMTWTQRAPSVPGASVAVTEGRMESVELLLTHDDATADRWLLDMEFSIPSAYGMRLPSILGRDILAHYRLIHAPQDAELTLDAPLRGPGAHP